jgi:hypothetical protein
MPLRGSAQLLLLFLRVRGRRAWVARAVAGGAVAAGLYFGGSAVPIPTAAEVAQVLRESAWDRALAEATEPSPWPWADAPAATTGKVARLGLSAAVVKEDQRQGMRGVDKPLRPVAAAAAPQSGTMVSKLAVGDRITVTTASGDSRVYRVTGPKVVDPHLAEGDSRAVGGDATDLTCVPPDPLLASSLGLVIQAIRSDPPAPEPGHEQKL